MSIPGRANLIPRCLALSVVVHMLAGVGYQAAPNWLGLSTAGLGALPRPDDRVAITLPPADPPELPKPEQPNPEPRPEPQVPPPPPPEAITSAVGDPDSTAAGTTWLGFLEYEEHASPEPTFLDQPAQSFVGGPRGEEISSPPVAPSPALTASAAETTPQSEPTPPAEPRAEASQPRTPTPAAPAPQPLPTENPAVEAREAQLESPAAPEPIRAPERREEPPPPKFEAPSDRPPEQSGLKETPRNDPEPPPPAPPEATPAPEDARPVSNQPPVEETPAERRAEQPVTPDEPGEAEKPVEALLPPTSIDPASESIQPPATDQSNEPAPPEGAPPAPPAPNAAPAEPSPPISPGAPDEGEAADRESDFAAIKKAVTVRAGQPVATRGLQIKTVRPQLSRFTSALSPINEAIARVSFNREGRAVNVRIIKGTGNRDKDRPLVDALHKWRAAGKTLEQLHDDRDPKFVEIEFRVIF